MKSSIVKVVCCKRPPFFELSLSKLPAGSRALVTATDHRCINPLDELLRLRDSSVRTQLPRRRRATAVTPGKVHSLPGGPN